MRWANWNTNYKEAIQHEERKGYGKFTTYSMEMSVSYVDTVGGNKKQLQEYIRHQLEEDKIADQIGLEEFIDPFAGSKSTK